MIKLKHHGKAIRKSAHTGDEGIARIREAELRQSLRSPGSTEVAAPAPPTPSIPTLREFMTNGFLDFIDKSFMIRPATRTYYGSGVKYLQGSNIADLLLNEITSRDIVRFGATLASFSPSTINCALKTLRRIFHLAKEWRVIDTVPRVPMARGERIRDRVLTPEEQVAYLQNCPQPWRDCATIIFGTGLRPGEVFALSWEDILLKEHSGFIQIASGKTPAARRILPMLPEVLEVFRRRAVNRRIWVFPSKSQCGHKTGDGARKAHLKALRLSKVKPFPPYTLRHTALTRLAVAGVPAHTLAVIAGHSTITMTSRYVHPQLEAIIRAFEKVGLPREPEEKIPDFPPRKEPED